MKWWTIAPAAAHLASVAPQSNSASSGCAAITSADAGTAKSIEKPVSAVIASCRWSLSEMRREIVGCVDVEFERCDPPHLQVEPAALRFVTVGLE